ncbi:MAG: glycosyltransferase family 4 protein [Clostridia bacterium]|nr:glycosyltransferase family 4 protein [Clostridia bacterium]
MITNKKIMMISTTDNMIWQFLLPHIQHLKELGNEVECVCAKTGFWFDELKEKHGLLMHEIDFGRNPIKLKNFKCFKKLKQLQKERKFDLVYCQQPVGGMMGRLIGKKFKLPVIYTAHGFHFFKGCPLVNKVVYKPVEKWLSKYTDILITINGEDYQSALKMKAKKVFKINGIGMTFKKYEDITETKEEIKASLGLDKNDFVIVTVAEFIKRKNYDTMLKTIKELKDRSVNVKFLICGRGQEESIIKNQIKDLDIENEVKILGFRKDINRILTASDVFMLASFQEGLTLSVIESMSFGLPCVVSNVRGNRDLIVDGKGGFVVETKNCSQYADKIEILKQDENLRKVFGLFNKEESKKYSIDAVKEELNEVYKWIS